MVEASKLLRGGRITSTREDVIKYISSAASDKKLLGHIIKINLAHTKMLAEQGIIKNEEASKLLKALNKVKDTKTSDSFEDVHIQVEEQVIDLVGSKIGGNLQIGKSRNDQVSTAIRMELRTELLNLANLLINLQKNMVELSKKHVITVILGYTHLQPAQPITFAHYLLSHVDALERDLERLMEAYSRVNKSPMGAGALATTSFPINRERVAESLGFKGLVENSIDAVTSRDFILDVLASLTIMSTNIDRLVEDLIIWSSYEFGVIEIPESYSSTSSIMPQKKNPDLLEVIRARTGQTVGNFLKATTILKGLPSSYNLDLQEMTPILWSSIETMKQTLLLLSKLVPQLRIESHSEKALLSFSTATELANMLVKKYEVPFRTSHKIVGALTKKLIEEKRTFKNLTPTHLSDAAKKIFGMKIQINVEDIETATDPLKVIKAHKAKGGPAPKEVKRMIKNRKKQLKNNKDWINKQHSLLEKMLK